MRLLKLLTIGAGLLLAAPAFAQVEGEGSGSASTDPNAAGGAGAGANGTVGVTAETGGMVGWGEQIIDNPVTLPKSALSVYGDFQILRLNFPPIPPATMGSTVTAEQLLIGAGYGVSDKITVGGQYGVPIYNGTDVFPNSLKGPLTFFGGYNIKTDTKMSIAAAADVTIDLGANDTTETIHAGLSARYNVAPKFAVFTGNPVAGFGPMAQHLSIGLNSKAPITFAVPVGAAFQASPKLFAFADTTIVNIGISNSDTAFIFDKFIPLELGALFRAANDLDVGVIFNDDLKNAGDAYVISLAARFVKH